MHPEVRADGPEACPICGMALEPVAPALDEPNPELVDFTARLRIGVAFTGPLFLLSMGGMLLPLPAFLGGATGQWIEAALASPVVLYCGAPFFVRGWDSLRSGHLNMFTLISLGVGTAFGFSLVALLAPGVLPDSALRADGLGDVYFEAAAVIVCLVLVGQVLELRARARTGEALRALLELAPAIAIRVRDGHDDEEIPLDRVAVGDLLRVVPGARVPVDAVVVSGRSPVDESMVSGEPLPSDKEPGDDVFGSTVNGPGALVVRATRIGSDTLVARIATGVAEAQRSRAPVQALVDRVSAVFVPAVVAVALVAFAAWIAVGPAPRLSHALVAAVSVLLIACPCALGLATPMSIMVAMGRGARAGVLFRNAEALEQLRAVDTLVVDKTGTLTEGRPVLGTVETAPDVGPDEILRAAAALERESEHPIARAIVAGARDRGIEVPAAGEFRALPGIGVRGRVEGSDMALGGPRMLEALREEGGASGPPELAARADALRAEGQSVLFAARDREVVALLAVTDPIAESAPGALEALRGSGIRVVMLTGDEETTARSVAARLGIDEVAAGMLPADKQTFVARLRDEGRVVAMAGDGINDAPALATADVGIAMGTGSDLAIESADVTLVDADLRGIVRARALSRATTANLRQNLAFAFGYNALGVPVAAGALYPLFGLTLEPMFAAAAMSLSSVSVIANALRLRAARIGA